MNKNLTEIIYILDRSGSMGGLEKDTIGGYNAFLEKQRQEEGEALISTVLFDHNTEVLHDRMDVREVKNITEKEYYVRGCTALLDAVGGAVHHISNVHKYIREEDRPFKTIVVITTDGMENASRRYSYSEVKRMIRQKEEKDNWEFLFIGANIDAAAEADKIGIREERSANYIPDAEGTKLFHEVVNETICYMRKAEAAPMDASWKTRIDEDYKNRKGGR